MALAESAMTAGAVAIALGAIEVAKLAVAKRNHRHPKNGMNSTGQINERFVAMVTANGTKIDQSNEVMKEVLSVMQDQAKTLVKIEATMHAYAPRARGT